MLEVDVTGFEDLQAKLRELEFAMQRKILIEGAKAGAEILLADIRSRAPRRTGAMAEGFKMQVSSKDSDVNEATVRVGNDRRQFYALFVEKGTTQRFRKKNHANSGTMRARPFVAPAVESCRDRMVQAMKAKVWELIRKVTNG